MLWISNLFLNLFEKNCYQRIALGESYILIIYRDLDATEKLSLDDEGVYKM